jgi:tRNA 5-methylaminomethyl-2-thiouridine biosynthesis bifunctional protein
MLKLTELNIQNADLQWPEEGTPYSAQFDDIYFSRQGGLAETEFVFIAANRLLERWHAQDQALAAGSATRNTFTITELGFGTGLNFLCTWRHWLEQAPAHLRLHYISCEKYPMSMAALQSALAQWTEFESLSEVMIRSYPDHSPGYHRLILKAPEIATEVMLDLYYGDACELLNEQLTRADAKVDAWFLDGFAPSANPDMWSPDLFACMARLSGPDTTLSTYSVAGHVVRGLAAAGFKVSKQPGFGQKRHMLHGQLDAEAEHQTKINPASNVWLRAPISANLDKRVIVIGAGMAGCSAAYALARRGYKVTVLEKNATIASGASGNRQAVLQCRINNALNESWLFNLSAFLYAQRHFNQLQSIQGDMQWHQCGVLNLDSAFSSRNKRCAPVKLDLYAEKVVTRLNQEQASATAGIALDGAANYQALGGWLNPTLLCQNYVRHPNISVLTNCAATHLERVDGQWQVHDGTGCVAAAATVIIANSVAAMEIEQSSTIILVPLRGQVSYVNANTKSENLSTIICGMSYISPAHNSLHSAGASYSKSVDDLSLSEQEHRENIEGIGPHLPEGAVTAEQVQSGRVSVRAASPDRMPIVGPVHDFAELEKTYLSLVHRDKQSDANVAPYHEGLYVNVGHGSHGLSNTPIAAEYLASLINQELSPLPNSVAEFIHPGRFFLRELKRRQTT